MRNQVSVLVLLFSSGMSFAQDAPFSESLYVTLEKVSCRTCHSSEGVASSTRLQFPEPGSSLEKIESFGKSLVALVDRNNPENSLIFRKPTGRLAHAGGARIKPGSPEEEQLKSYIQKLAKLPPDELAKAMKYREREAAGADYEKVQVSLQRLTHAQYNNVIRDLLGDTSRPADQFPPEDYVSGFKTQFQAQSISPLLMESYSAAAEKLARNAFRTGDSRNLIPCKVDAPGCKEKFVKEFGLRAFRRPLTEIEEQRYLSLFKIEPSFIKGAQLAVEAMLQSPNFLFRLDETSDPSLKSWATANRLAFALWHSMPDNALLEAARTGKLSTEEEIRKMAQRLIADPKARDNVDEFASQWLRYDRVLSASKDRRQFRNFNRETAVAMTHEARHFINDLVWNDRNFMELYTADWGYLTPDLATIYGLPAPTREYEKVKFQPDSGRAGILGQALFLTITAKPDDTAPTERGLFVREQFLCQHVAPPPPGVNTVLPPLSDAKPLSNRDRLAQHLTNPSCAGCHNLIDPIGFGLEKFNAIGEKREKATILFAPMFGRPDQTKKVDVELDTTGSIAGIPNSNFSSPKELGEILAKTPGCQECVVKQFFRYTMGRMETRADRPMIDSIVRDFKNSEFKFKEMMISLVVHREVQGKKTGGTSSVARNHQAR